MLLTCFSFHYDPDKDHSENVLRIFHIRKRMLKNLKKNRVAKYILCASRKRLEYKKIHFFILDNFFLNKLENLYRRPEVVRRQIRIFIRIYYPLSFISCAVPPSAGTCWTASGLVEGPGGSSCAVVRRQELRAGLPFLRRAAAELGKG